MSPRTHKILTYGCLFMALAFVAMKWLFAYWWWYDVFRIWAIAFRMSPDWGTGAALYGALLPAKWIGSSNFAYGLLILITMYFSHRHKNYQFLGFLLLQGVFIEFFDGFWVANGKFNVGWFAGGLGEVSMVGGFAWGPVLLFCAIYLLGKKYLESQQRAA
jgi:hypothetical protein